MMTTLAETQAKIDGTVKSPVEGLIERIARGVGGIATVNAVYGTPVDRDGVTIIPVAAVRSGFGGGGGSDQSDAVGGGGGGAASVTPIGYIELRNGTVAFRPIRVPVSPLTILPLVLVGGLNCWLILRGLRRLLRP